jgi:hypothetical protein
MNDEKPKKESVSNTLRSTVLGVIVAIILIAFILLVLLTLSQPVIGNVFSNVVQDLGTTTIPTQEADETEALPNTPVPPTATRIPPTQTQRPTNEPSATPSSTLPVLLTAGVNQMTSVAETEGTIEAASVRETLTAESAEAGDEPTEVPAATEEPLPESTEEALPTPLPQPTIIADAHLQIRDSVSGEIFGDGTISLYAPDVIMPGQSVRVELELNLANLYITPTPSGGITPYPVPTRITATPPTHNSLGTPLPSPSPRFPIHEESGVQFYQRMGASLLCPPDSFSGCDSERSLSRARIVTTTTTRYSWLLNQQEAAAGVQNLNIELWAVFANLDGELEYVTQWEHPFTIEIVTEASSTFPVWTVVLTAAVILASIAGVVIYQRAKPQPAQAFGANNKGKPKVFISYRRQPSWSLARSVATSLERRGADVFLDVDDINEGRFSEMIQQAIENCDYFVPILSPDTLESKWVRREIEMAIQLKKTIVPLTTDGFNFYGTDLPENLQELSSHNAITITPEFFEAAIDRLATRFLKLGDEK